jgi:hypothetical protein
MVLIADEPSASHRRGNTLFQPHLRGRLVPLERLFNYLPCEIPKNQKTSKNLRSSAFISG